MTSRRSVLSLNGSDLHLLGGVIADMVKVAMPGSGAEAILPKQSHDRVFIDFSMGPKRLRVILTTNGATVINLFDRTRHPCGQLFKASMLEHGFFAKMEGFFRELSQGNAQRPARRDEDNPQ